MSRGVVYLMTSHIPEIIKIGSCLTDQFETRMRRLENNGYRNITGLKRKFAIEVDNYDDKEKLLHKVFKIFQFGDDGDNELFKINDFNLVIDLMKTMGKQFYPPIEHERQEGNRTRNATRSRRDSIKFSMVDIPIGAKLQWKKDPAIEVEVVSDDEVRYNGVTKSTCGMANFLRQEKYGKKEKGSGFSVFLYEGETIYKRRKRMESRINEQNRDE